MYRTKKTTAAMLASVLMVCASPGRGQPNGEFRETRTLAAPPGDVRELAAVDDSLVVRTPYQISVFDAAGTAQHHEPLSEFTDMDLSPSGKYLYVADWAEERPRGNATRGVHAVHRLDIARGTWETARLPEAEALLAFRVEAFDDTRFVIAGEDQSSTLHVMEWGRPPRVLSASVSPYQPEMAYDDARGRLWWTSRGLSPRSVNEFWVGDRLVVSLAGVGPHKGSPRRPERVLLATDASRLYIGAFQLDLAFPIAEQAEGSRHEGRARVFPEPIYAATQVYAFGEAFTYDPESGRQIAELPVASQVMTTSTDGARLWLLDADAGRLREFDLGGPDKPAQIDKPESQPFEVLDQYITAVASGQVDELIAQTYDATGAVEWAYGEEFKKLGPTDKRLVETMFRRLLRERLLDPELRRVHAEYVVTWTSMGHSEGADYRMTYRLKKRGTREEFKTTLTARRGREGRWLFEDVEFGRVGFRGHAKRAQETSGLSFLEWAGGKPIRAEAPTVARVTPNAGMPADPAEAAAWFRAMFETGRTMELVEQGFSLEHAAARIFGTKWKQVSEEEKEEIQFFLALNFGTWLMLAEAETSEIVGASVRPAQDLRVVRYAVRVNGRRTFSEQMLQAETASGWRMVDATVGGEWLLRPRAADFKRAGVEPLRFARMAFRPPGGGDRPAGSSIPDDWVPGTGDPVSTVDGFQKLVLAGRIDEAFEACVLEDEVLASVFGEAIDDLSSADRSRLRQLLRELLLPHEDPYALAELKRTEMSEPRSVESSGDTTLVEADWTEVGAEHTRTIVFSLVKSEGGYLIHDLRGDFGSVIELLGEQFHATGGSPAAFLEQMTDGG